MAHTPQPGCWGVVSSSVSAGIHLLFHGPRHLAWHLKSPHFSYFSTPDSEKLTLRDLAVLWLYNQITPRALMDFKGVLQLQIAAEIGPSESGVSSWVFGPPHGTGMALNLADFGDNRPLDTPQSPPNAPGDLSACIYTTGTHKGG